MHLPRLASSRALSLALTLCALAPASQAATASYVVQGTITDNWGWNYPAAVPAVGTPYSFTLNYDPDTPVGPLYLGSTSYLGAIKSVSMSVGGFSFSGQGGNVYINSAATGSFISFQAWATHGAAFDATVAPFNGFYVNSMTVDLRAPGALATGTALPTDLSGFALGTGYAQYDLISKVSPSDGRIVGTGAPTSISAVPEPASAALFAVGALGLLASLRRRAV